MIEAVVASTLLIIIGFVALSLVLSVQVVGSKGNAAQALYKMKQLHLATRQMTLDSMDYDDPKGIRGTCSNGKPLAYDEWTNLLVRQKYLTSQQIADLTTVTERVPFFPRVQQQTPSPSSPTTTQTRLNLVPRQQELAWPLRPKAERPPLRNQRLRRLPHRRDGAILRPSQCQDAALVGIVGKFGLSAFAMKPTHHSYRR